MDHYPKLGKKHRLLDEESAPRLVTEMWPNAIQKDEYFWSGTETDDPYIVAYIFKDKKGLWLRRARSLNTVVFPD